MKRKKEEEGFISPLSLSVLKERKRKRKRMK
jgi:hypothetical protein